MLILDIMENIFKIRGNRHMVCVSQERVVKVVGVNTYRNIQNNCLKQCLILMINLTKFKDYNHAIKIGI